MTVKYRHWQDALKIVKVARMDRKMMDDPAPPTQKAISVYALAYARQNTN